MDIRMLQIFVAVAEEGGFTRASQRLHLVQSSVSASVKTLETELGYRLFERGTRSVRLTAEGKSFLVEAREASAAFERARTAAIELGEGVSGTVSVGILVIPDMLGIADAVARLHHEHPRIRITVRTAAGGSESIVKDVADGTLDMSFVVLPLPYTEPAGLVMEPMLAGRYILACGRNHPLASRSDTIAISELDGADFIDFPSGFSLRRAVDDLFARTPYRRRTHVEVAHLELIATYIAAGVGIGVVTDDVLNRNADLVRLDVPWLDLSWRVAIARRQNSRPSRAAETFLEAIRENCRRAVAEGIADAAT